MERGWVAFGLAGGIRAPSNTDADGLKESQRKASGGSLAIQGGHISQTARIQSSFTNPFSVRRHTAAQVAAFIYHQDIDLARQGTDSNACGGGYDKRKERGNEY